VEKTDAMTIVKIASVKENGKSKEQKKELNVLIEKNVDGWQLM
jgi:hypothetical protein